MTAPGDSGRSAGLLGAAPTVALAMLPKLTCPVCWPAYTAALGALGLGFVDYTPYLLPLTAAFVAISFGALAWTVRARGILPLCLGMLGATALLLGKFAFEDDVLTYGGIGLLVIAPLLPWRRRTETSCPRCDRQPEKEIAT